MLKTYQLRILLQTTIHKLSNIQYLSNRPCICGSSSSRFRKRIVLNNVFSKISRLRSTHSDQHRQKVVIETTTPKIVIDKIGNEKLFDNKERLNDLRLFNNWKRQLDPYIKLARWDKPTGVYLLYWPCTWSIALGSISSNVPLPATLSTAGLFLVGAGLMRGAGCTINDLWDKDIDKQVERTKTRPLASGLLNKHQAVKLLALQLSGALGVLLQLNCYSVVLGASSLFLVITYPLAKRFTNYPQIFLGATFNWGTLLGYTAIQGDIDAGVCIPLYAGALAWTVVYDTVYAHQDKLDDARIGVKSTALTFGSNTKPILLCTLAASTICLSGSGLYADLNLAYPIGVIASAAFLGKQLYNLDLNNSQQCAKFFSSNSWFGFLVLLSIMAGGYKKYMDNREKSKTETEINLESTKSCVFS